MVRNKLRLFGVLAGLGFGLVIFAWAGRTGSVDRRRAAAFLPVAEPDEAPRAAEASVKRTVAAEEAPTDRPKELPEAGDASEAWVAAHVRTKDVPDRNPAWATPLEAPGLTNAYKVTAGLYRGAQPTTEGMQTLKRMGVKTVLNLRTLHSDRDEIGDTGLAYEHIRFNPLNPEKGEIVRALQILTDKSRQPVFVHCAHGADRTGTVCAFYRMGVQGWSKAEAVEEMTEGGYGFHRIYQNLLEYIREIDLSVIRQRAEIAAPPERDAGAPETP